jgi:hypothetical protein
MPLPYFPFSLIREVNPYGGIKCNSVSTEGADLIFIINLCLAEPKKPVKRA